MDRMLHTVCVGVTETMATSGLNGDMQGLKWCHRITPEKQLLVKVIVGSCI